MRSQTWHRAPGLLVCAVLAGCQFDSLAPGKLGSGAGIVSPAADAAGSSTSESSLGHEDMTAEPTAPATPADGGA
ncbi:MAG: hypothetical protein RL701_2265, partial [Pseudomonadota bacterium]